MSSEKNDQPQPSTKKSKKRARENNQDPAPLKKQKQNQATPTPTPSNGTKQKDKSKKQQTQHVNGASNVEPAVSHKKIALNDGQLQKHSPFSHETQSLFVGLSPVSHRFPLEGACAEFLSPLLLTYYPPFNGVVLSYSNPRLSEHPDHAVQDQQKVMGRSIDEYAVTYIWLTAEFLVFRPVIGTVLEGYVTLQNQSILGLLCYNYFSAGIEQSRLPSDWKWVEGEEDNDEDQTNTQDQEVPRSNGRYVHATGRTVEGKILFKVKDFEASAGSDGITSTINIYGTLLRDQDDAKVDAELRQHALVS